MTRRIIVLPMFLALMASVTASCQTVGGVTLRTINTIPAGAKLTVSGYGECETPCSVALDQPRRATIAKAGFIKQDVILQPGRGDLTFELSLAAPTSDVDATALPDIQ